MNENISFRRLKAVIKSKGMTLKEVAEKCGIRVAGLSNVCSDTRTPLTVLVAKLCYLLECYPSEIVVFDNIEIDTEIFTADKREPLLKNVKGELTYKPFFIFLTEYIINWNKSHEEKISEKLLFDKIEPPRRVAGIQLLDKSGVKAALEKRWGKDYKSPRTNRTEYTGIPLISRSKLRHDRPVNLSLIYEICKYFKCPIDFVLGYK